MAHFDISSFVVTLVHDCDGASTAIPSGLGRLLLIRPAGTSKAPTSTSAVRKYNGTASVGDFLTISLDSNAHNIEYVNHTNGDSGTVPYTVNVDGTYAVIDPQGNLLAAYEVPGFVLLAETAKSGPTHSTPALITAIESVPTSISNLAGQNFNYMQWRTSSGGMEVGSVSIDALGDIQHDSFRPSAVLNQSPNYFGGGTFPQPVFRKTSPGTSSPFTNRRATPTTLFSALRTGFGLLMAAVVRFSDYPRPPPKPLTRPQRGPTPRSTMKRPMHKPVRTT